MIRMKKRVRLSRKAYIQAIKNYLDPILFAIKVDPQACGVTPSWKENGGITNVHKFKARFSEDQIAQNSKYAYFYARLTGRKFELGEPAIAKDVESAYMYSRYILRSEFPQAEALIAKFADWSYYYARDVLRGPFKAGEEAISQDSRWSFLYALNVLLKSYAEALIWQETYRNNITANTSDL